MKPIIFNQFGNCCNFSWEHWSILIIWWLVRSRKLVCDLDQSSRRNVKTGYFREDGSRLLEIAAVHVASVKVRHLPVNPGHLSTSTGMESEENEISSSYFVFRILVSTELCRSPGHVGIIQTNEDSGRVCGLQSGNHPSIQYSHQIIHHFLSPDPAEPSSNTLVLVCSLGAGIFSGSCCSRLCISMSRESQCRPESPAPVWR